MSTSTLSAQTAIPTRGSLSPMQAESVLKSMIASALKSAPGTVCEIMVTPTVELRIERMSSGAKFELNDLAAIDHIWEQQYANGKWALRGVINATTAAGLDVRFASDFTRSKSKAAAAGPEAGLIRPSNGSIWRKITIELGEEADVELAGKKTAILVSEHDDGTATATFAWLGEVYEESFESLWHAKSYSLKAAETVLRWWKPSDNTAA